MHSVELSDTNLVTDSHPIRGVHDGESGGTEITPAGDATRG